MTKNSKKKQSPEMAIARQSAQIQQTLVQLQSELSRFDTDNGLLLSLRHLQTVYARAIKSKAFIDSTPVADRLIMFNRISELLPMLQDVFELSVKVDNLIVDIDES